MLNKLLQQKGKKKPPIFVGDITKQSYRIYTNQINLLHGTPSEKGKKIGLLWQRERKVTIIPLSGVPSFPFIAVYLADAQSKCDEAAEQDIL